MNIKKAKEQIINTVRAYLQKDEYGRYIIPQNRQRPLFIVGAPGIGKTEIMSQAAAELGICLVSYSMTHHTRQSALGLPVIKHRKYGNTESDVSEYTMSEIISSVYDIMENTGIENGILFLDEINCISETLNPIMLQFLQYKVFGGHRLPEGWIVAAAGNPPEYNNSVREFDIVTLDRLKRIDVEPDFSTWKEFAYSSKVHGSVVTYLEIKPQNFYKTETTVNGKSFVTARGWDDLGRIIGVYESLEIEVDKELVRQYIQNDKIAEDFAVYYELYRKYRSDYQIYSILSGRAGESIFRRAANAGFDERYSLLGLLLEAAGNEAAEILENDELLIFQRKIAEDLKNIPESCKDILDIHINEIEQQRSRLIASNSLSAENDRILIRKISILKEYRKKSEKNSVKSAYEENVAVFRGQLRQVKTYFSNLFTFCESVFGKGQEILILVTELAANPVTARYISAFGCDEYYKFDKELMFYERRLGIISDINKIL